MSLYLDTSVVVPLFVSEGGSDRVLRWIAEQTDPLMLSDLTVTEFHAVISRLVRQGVIDASHAEEIREQFDLWREAATEPLENLPADIRAAGQLVRSPLPKLLTADATHLATCRRLGMTLVTADLDLHSIAAREGVECGRPS